MLMAPRSVVQLEVLTPAQAAGLETPGVLIRVRSAPDQWRALIEKIVAEERGSAAGVVARIMTSGASYGMVTTQDVLRGTSHVVPVHVFAFSQRDYDRLSGVQSSSDSECY
jgi:hypothetical protein